MRARVAGVALALLLGTAFLADAETIWIDRAKLLPDPGSAGALTFTVAVQAGGSFAARILCQGEKGKKYLLELELRPEDGGAPQSVQFSFTGSGCDWLSWLEVTGSDRLQLEQGTYRGRLSPADQEVLVVNHLVLDSTL